MLFKALFNIATQLSWLMFRIIIQLSSNAFKIIKTLSPSLTVASVIANKLNYINICLIHAPLQLNLSLINSNKLLYSQNSTSPVWILTAELWLMLLLRNVIELTPKLWTIINIITCASKPACKMNLALNNSV